MKKFIAIILSFVALATSSVKAQSVEQRIILDVPFVLQGGALEDILWSADSVALAQTLREIELLSYDTTAVVRKVTFYGSCSPEGTVAINKKLSRSRMLTIETMVRRSLQLNDVVVEFDDRYIPWVSYLLPAIEADLTVPYRDELIDIVGNVPDEGERDRRRVQLRRARGGKLWDIVEERWFPNMRKGGAIIVVERELCGDIASPLPSFIVRPLSAGEFYMPVEEPAPVEEPQEEPRHAVSIKTNAAMWATLSLNLGFEVKLAPRWSLDVMGVYSPYNLFAFDRKIRLFGIRPEVRYWWGEPMKRGHFLGLHGHTAGFNVQLNDKYRYQDPNHALWGVGLSYGYAMPLGKKQRWGVEFTLGVGYARIKYDKYEGRENGQFIERKTINYVGPTRLGINFSYRFDIAGRKKGNKQ